MGSQCKPQFHLTCTVACTALSSCPRPWCPGRLRSPGVRSGWAPARAAVWGWGAGRSQDTAAFWRHYGKKSWQRGAEHKPGFRSALLNYHVSRAGASPAVLHCSRAIAAGCMDGRNVSWGTAAFCPSAAQPWLFGERTTAGPAARRNRLPGTKPSVLEGPRCKALLHLESSGSLIVLLNINGLVIS